MKKYLISQMMFFIIIGLQAQDLRWGYALQFNGTTNFATADALCAPLVGKDFTIEFWFKLSGTPSDFNALAVFNPPSADATDNRIETGVGYGADQKFYVYSPNSGMVTTYGTTTITVGTWYHVAITYTYTTGNIVAYLNGQQELTKTIPASDRIQSNDRFSLGQEWDNSSRSALFHGELDEVRIWDDIRTISELNYNRDKELAGTDANLLAYYKMSDGSGTSLTDDSPNSYTGTLLNGIAWVISTIPHPYSGGTGVSGSPYQIATAANQIYLSQHSEDWGKYFIQTANIDFGADETLVDWNGDGTADGSGTTGFSPIGNATTKFTGNYDGGSHTIRQLYINRPQAVTPTGFFGQINGSSISNVGLVDASVNGGFDTGILVGNSSIGGASSINNCYSTGTVTSGYMNIGGLVGLNQYSLINNSYSQATASGSNNVGGLVGSLYSSTITNCYSVGVVTALYSNIGGLIGNILNSTIANSFWDTQTSGQSTSAGGTGLTTVQMKTASSYTNWDFATPIWKIKTGDYISYPYLQGFSYDTPGATSTVNPIPGLEYIGYTLSNLSVTGSNIKWYSASTGGTVLASSTALVNGTTYYASQTVNGIESTARLAVTANITSVPTPATHTATGTSITWNWNASTNATGYKWNTTNNYGTATDLGNVTTFTKTGLSGNTSYTIYVWAYTASCNTGAVTFTQSTSSIID